MGKLSYQVSDLEEEVEILRKRLESKERGRVVTDDQLKVMFWYISEVLYHCADSKILKEEGLDYDCDIRTTFLDLSGYREGFKGSNIRNDSYYNRCYKIMKKCYDEHNKY